MVSNGNFDDIPMAVEKYVGREFRVRIFQAVIGIVERYCVFNQMCPGR